MISTYPIPTLMLHTPPVNNQTLSICLLLWPFECEIPSTHDGLTKVIEAMIHVVPLRFDDFLKACGIVSFKGEAQQRRMFSYLYQAVKLVKDGNIVQSAAFRGFTGRQIELRGIMH